MVVCADFMCMAQTAFASQRFDQDSAAYVWMVFCVLLSFVVGLLLLARSRYPHATFVAACVAVLVFPVRFHHRVDGVDRAVGSSQ